MSKSSPPARNEASDGGSAEAGHRTFQDFLADVRPADLPALRHLVLCPLCLGMARIVLSSASDSSNSSDPSDGRRRGPGRTSPATRLWRRHR